MHKAQLCTWMHCRRPSFVTMLDRGMKQWAAVCEQHYDEIMSTIEAGLEEPGKHAPAILRVWARARGGSPISSSGRTLRNP